MGVAFSQITEVCQEAGGFFNKVCLPIAVDCDCTWKEGIWADCDETWNCNRCDADQPFHMPFVRGDKIMFQTAFFDRYNADRTMPTAGYNDWILVELCDKDGNVVSSDISQFASRYWVGWACGKSYQTFELDTSLEIVPDCFNIKLTVYENEALDIQEELCSQDFSVVNCTEDTFVIESEYGSMDCTKACYQEPDSYVGSGSFAYSNKMRFPGYLLDETTQLEKQRTGDVHRYVEITEEYRLVLYGLLAPYAKNILVKQILAGMNIEIDDEPYLLDTFRIQNEINFNNMFKFDVTGLYRECENRNSSLC